MEKLLYVVFLVEFIVKIIVYLFVLTLFNEGA